MDKEDAKTEEFSLWEGHWISKLPPAGHVHEYIIHKNGTLTFDRAWGAGGDQLSTDGQRTAKLTRQNGAVVAIFGSGEVIDRYRPKGSGIFVERWYHAKDYPKARPNDQGEGKLEPVDPK